MDDEEGGDDDDDDPHLHHHDLEAWGTILDTQDRQWSVLLPSVVLGSTGLGLM